MTAVGKDYMVGGAAVQALGAIDLNIGAGEFVAVMGTSGSGKSTLMNIIGLLDRPSRGRYVLNGADVSRLSPDARALCRRSLGFVFQGFNLLARTSAEDNVALPLLYANVPRQERRARARAALERVGLGQRMDHTPQQLSGGQQQRVAIARALVTAPKLLLADEPTGNLDSRTSIEVMALLQDVWRSGLPVVLVTHEPEIAQFASRTLVFRDGAIVRDTPNTQMRDARQAVPT